MLKNKIQRYCRNIAAVALLWIAFNYISNLWFRYGFFVLLLIVLGSDLWGELKKKLSFKKGFVCAALFVGVSMIITKVFPTSEKMAQVTLSGAIASIFLAPVCEELFFRKTINEGVNDIIAALLSSVIFGAVHGREMFIPSAVAGLTLYLIYKLTGSLKASIIAHMTNNALAIMYHPDTIEFFRNLIR